MFAVSGVVVLALVCWEMLRESPPVPDSAAASGTGSDAAPADMHAGQTGADEADADGGGGGVAGVGSGDVAESYAADADGAADADTVGPGGVSDAADDTASS